MNVESKQDLKDHITYLEEKVKFLEEINRLYKLQLTA